MANGDEEVILQRFRIYYKTFDSGARIFHDAGTIFHYVLNLLKLDEKRNAVEVEMVKKEMMDIVEKHVLCMNRFCIFLNIGQDDPNICIGEILSAAYEICKHFEKKANVEPIKSFSIEPYNTREKMEADDQDQKQNQPAA